MLDIILPVYNGLHHVRSCLRSVREHTVEPYRLYVVDDGSLPYVNYQVRTLLDDLWRGSPAPPELLVNAENRGYLLSVNRGLEAGENPFIILLNSDTVVTPGWNTGLIEVLLRSPDIAIACPVSNHANFTRVDMPSGLTFLEAAETVRRMKRTDHPDIGLASGFCFIARRSLYHEIGAFDPLYGPGYYEESDLCMRALEQGYRVVGDGCTFIYHHGWGSFGQDSRNTWMVRNRELFEQRWGGAHDLYKERFLSDKPFASQEEALREAVPSRVDPPSPQRVPGMDRSAPRHTQRTPEEWKKFADLVHRRAQPPGGDESTPLRILYLLPGLGAYGGVISVIQLVNRMLLSGVQAQVATMGKVDIRIYREPMYFRPFIMRDLEQMMMTLPRFDVIVATRWDTVYDALELADEWQVPIISFVQDFEPGTETEASDQAAAELSLQLVRHKIVKSRWLEGKMQPYGGIIHRVSLGLNLDIFHPGGDPRRAEGPIRVLAAARPGAPHRNLEGTVEIFRLLTRRRPDVIPTFFGKSFDVDLPIFEHLGPLSQTEVAAALRSTAVLLDASVFQGFGRPGLEAMGCGVPTVLTTKGGINEYARDGVNCLQIDPGDVASFASAIEGLLEQTPLRGRLVAEGLKTASQYDVEKEARTTIALVERLARGDEERRRQ